MNQKPIILNGGPYIVRTNKYRGIEYEYGWVELVIDKNNIQAICENDGCIRTILNFNINVEVPREYKYLEMIQIYLKLGFNSIYAYSYSDITKFKEGCIQYFTTLALQIEKDNNCK
jgi:hypothetical protein